MFTHQRNKKNSILSYLKLKKKSVLEKVLIYILQSEAFY